MATSEREDSGTLTGAVVCALLGEFVAALKADPGLRVEVLALLQPTRARPPKDERMMTVGQVAAVLNVSERSVYRALRDGRLGGVRVGSSWRIAPAAVEDWKLGGREGAAERAPSRRAGSYEVARRALAA